MPAYWQITKLRAEQSYPVWALVDDFRVGNKGLDDLSVLLEGYLPLINAFNTVVAGFSTANTAKKDLLETLKMICVKGAGKMSADLDDDHPLDIALGQKVFSIVPDTEDKIIERAHAFVPIWKLYNADATLGGPLLIRGKTVAMFETLLGATGYEGAVDGENAADTALSTATTALEQHNRIVDRLIKKWYAAWKNEYPEGTTEGDALLSQVDAEEGQQRPSKLELTLATAPGLKVAVTFPPGGGAHATLRLLQIKVIGVDADFRTVRELTVEDVAAGVEIGPFTLGQQVKVRSDVGNSRDPSEISEEQSIVIA